MEYVVFLALSAISAVLFLPVSGWINTRAASVTNSQAKQFLGTYAGRTAVQTAAFFVVLMLAASLMSLVGGKKAADIPTPL